MEIVCHKLLKNAAIGCQIGAVSATIACQVHWSQELINVHTPWITDWIVIKITVNTLDKVPQIVDATVTTFVHNVVKNVTIPVHTLDTVVEILCQIELKNAPKLENILDAP